MQPTARPNRITIDLLHYKQPWIDYCKAHNTTPSEAFRMVVAKLTSGVAIVHEENELIEQGKVRREIRLTREELRAAESLATIEGFALTRWIVALLRARLSSSPQLGQRELELLARSNMQLLAIGRNLNQIARALNATPSDPSGWNPELIEKLRGLLQEHTLNVAQVLETNVQRWRGK